MGVMGFMESLFMITTLHDQPERIEKGFGDFIFKLTLNKELEYIEY